MKSDSTPMELSFRVGFGLPPLGQHVPHLRQFSPGNSPSSPPPFIYAESARHNTEAFRSYHKCTEKLDISFSVGNNITNKTAGAEQWKNKTCLLNTQKLFLLKTCLACYSLYGIYKCALTQSIENLLLKNNSNNGILR